LIQALRAEVQALQQQVRDLQERLNQNSTNSSRPPSTDPPAVKRRPPRPPSGRPSGGQPGHARQQRPLLPPDHTEVLKPAGTDMTTLKVFQLQFAEPEDRWIGGDLLLNLPFRQIGRGEADGFQFDKGHWAVPN
jgi:hypothetical protein